MQTPRLPRVSRRDADAQTAAIYDRYQRERGNVPNMFRTVALRPEILATMIAHMEAVLKTGTVPTRLKELAVCRTSILNGCEYCLASHAQIARKLGYSQAQLDALEEPASYADRDDFSLAEKLIVRLAETVTANKGPVPDAMFTELLEHFSEGEVVELLSAIGLFNYFNRFNNALQMEPTPPATAEELAEGRLLAGAGV